MPFVWRVQTTGEGSLGNNAPCLWIIDNMHKIMNALEDFPDVSVWEKDYCICCSRSINGLTILDNPFLDIGITKKQIFKRDINEEEFFCCIRKYFPTLNINRKKSDYLFRYFGGNLAILGYSEIDGIKDYLDDNSYEKVSFYFHNIYQRYFVTGKYGNEKLNFSNVSEVLKMLFLSQLDFAIPFNLQYPVCETILKEYYEVNRKNELDFAHASLAELLTTSICIENHLDYKSYFFSSICWTVDNIFRLMLTSDEKIKQINDFLKALYGYQFILQINQTIDLERFLNDNEILINFIKSNIKFISCYTWKTMFKVISKYSNLYEIFFNHFISSEFTYSLLNCGDYDFRFVSDILETCEIYEAEKYLLINSTVIKSNIVERQNEIHLMLFLCSLSETSAYSFLEQIPSNELIKLLLNNDNGLYLYAYYAEHLSENLQILLDSKLSIENYREICINSASILGFVYLLASNLEKTRNKMTYLLFDNNFIEMLIHNTIIKKFSLGKINLSLRKLKINFPQILVEFENAIKVNGYLVLLDSFGTIPILLGIMRNSSLEMQKKLSEELIIQSEIVKGLLDRTLQSGVSLGTINLALRQLKMESPGALEEFEKAIGVNGYFILIENLATVPVLAGIIRNSSIEMYMSLINRLMNDSTVIGILVERTIQKDESIGTLGFALRELKKESIDALLAFEKAIGSEQYLTLFDALGTIPILARTIQHSSLEMQTEISYKLREQPHIVKAVLERTIQSGDSLGTLNLSLRELKSENSMALIAFEEAIGVSGYLQLIKKQATIQMLGGILRYSSIEMQRNLLDELMTLPPSFGVSKRRGKGQICRYAQMENLAQFCSN